MAFAAGAVTGISSLMLRRYLWIAAIAAGALLAAPLSGDAQAKKAAHAKHKAKKERVAAPERPVALNEPHLVAAQSCDRADFRLLIDVGHTLEAAGAVSARGIDEFQYNLTLAKETAQTLRERGFTKTTLLITEGKTKPGLYSRVSKINKASPDLLLSIHHDSVPDGFIQKFEYDDKLRGFSDRFAGHSVFVSAANPHYAASVLFGRILGNEMTAHGLHYTPHYIDKIMGNRQRLLVDAEAGLYRYDGLLVLKQTRVPAVLLEAGSIINREEEWQLRLPKRRAQITNSVADAVDLYCKFHPPASAAQIAARTPEPAPAKIAKRVAARKTAKTGTKQVAHRGPAVQTAHAAPQ
jgi:N-acetylmuramoyl-L-alanine amidase